MLETGTILLCSFGYIGLLFVIAYHGRKRFDEGRSIISNPYIYALSLAVYCTAWTFYGSVGRAAQTGPGFLPTYLGPTFVAAMGWIVLRKIIRISKIHHITSIADFIASRYGKSAKLGGTVTVIAVLGVLPYISLQLKAISTSFLLIQGYPEISGHINFADIPVFWDTAFYVALLLAVFTILFGTRHLDVTERHEGLVAAIAFESVVKLLAFIAVGVFVTFFMYDGFGDIFRKAAAVPEMKALWTLDLKTGSHFSWFIHIVLAMTAMMFLPRQFQIAVVENVNEAHLSKAVWLFPLYLLAINLFVLPIAMGGMMRFPGGSVEADTFVLSLPMVMHQEGLALFVFIGGMSAATGMVIIESTALSTMICNDLVVPVLLRKNLLPTGDHGDISRLLLNIRRGSVVLILLLGYAYFRFVGEFYSLVSIGLVSFAAVSQFAPAMLCGIYWRSGNRKGAMWGIITGFLVWGYTLVLPSLVQAGFLPMSFITDGPLGIAWLKPFQLFGLTGMDNIAHAVFWSLLINMCTFVFVSLFSETSTIEHTQAAMFVDVFKYSGDPVRSPSWKGTASVPDLRLLLGRFMSKQKVDEAIEEYARSRNFSSYQELTSDIGLVSYAEKLLAGAIGSASARVMVSSVVKEEPLGIDEVMDILDETRKVIMYSHELERTTSELQAANERLKELDGLKDEFISTVTHELRTPLTSVRSLAEIIHDNPNLEEARRSEFSALIIKESERLTRLISQVLDVQKIESGKMGWHMVPVDLIDVIADALATTDRLVQEKDIILVTNLNVNSAMVVGDADRLIQVMVNLVSNAVKFCPPVGGKITITLSRKVGLFQVDVTDNGIGIGPDDQGYIFDKFRQVRDSARGRPPGTGLGLAITKHIVDFHGGIIRVESEPGEGSTFSFQLPAHENGAASISTDKQPSIGKPPG